MVCFSLTLSLARSRTSAQMSWILAKSNADGYYRNGLIRTPERVCRLCMSLSIIDRSRVAETLQRCWPHLLPWADVLACGFCVIFIILTSSHFHVEFILLMVVSLLGWWQIWQSLFLRPLCFYGVIYRCWADFVSVRRTDNTTADLLDILVFWC